MMSRSGGDHVDLTDTEHRLLATLIDRHGTTESPVKGPVLADDLDRSTATVRNWVGNLTALGLVEGIQGPKGGYRPTAKAYDVLDRQDLDEPATLTMAREFDRIDVVVDRIDFTDVNHPDACRARVRLRGIAHRIDVGDAIALGPTPVANLLLAGEVMDTEEDCGAVTLDVADIDTASEP
jgi:predicted transcriptional regulator